ncbi:MAG: hypothetical protein P8P90_08865 [Opitutales bacterium]|nr:hypothetical protein [Opitutales bacterium]
MISLFPNRLFYLSCLVLIAFSCSDNKPDAEEPVSLPPTVDEKPELATLPTKPVPVVYIEELDQYQEYFKEQHETSFSHVAKKNWSSYTAGKDGILTKVLLFGKPNYMISEHYGSSMSGFIRADNPDSGPKYGEWSLTRDGIINQLALQGLTETDRGWITLQMRGEIPQQKGRLYFIVCDQIGNKRSWFGAFAFAEGNSYKQGRFWLHPQHDLVFRTYVGKTADQLEKEQKGEPLFDSDSATLVPTNDIPEAPKPMIELSKNFQPAPPTLPQEKNLEQKTSIKEETLYQPATQAFEQEQPTTEAPSEESVDQIIEEPKELDSSVIESRAIPAETSEPVEDKEVPKGSLFERFFKNKTE